MGVSGIRGVMPKNMALKGGCQKILGINGLTKKISFKFCIDGIFQCKYNQTSLIRTPKGQNQLSPLQRCPYYRGSECMIFDISGTKQTVPNREVSVLYP